MTRIFRPRFDPAKDYVVSYKGLTFGGKTFKPGEPFKENTPLRIYRVLYDGRFLDMAPEEKEAPPESTSTVETEQPVVEPEEGTGDDPPPEE